MVTGDDLTVVVVVGAAVVVIGTGAGFLTTGAGGLFLKASFFQFGLGNCVFLSLLGFALGGEDCAVPSVDAQNVSQGGF